MSKAVDTYVAYKFIQLLTTPWKDQEAFEHGIIDDKGKVLKKSKTLRNSNEKNSYTIFHRLVFNLKRLLDKFPAGRTKIGSFAAALFLIKEHVESSGDMEKEFWNLLKEEYDIDPFMLYENVINEGTLNKGTYKLINDIIDSNGVKIKSGTKINVKKSLKQKTTILGNDIFVITVNNSQISLSKDDIEKV